jgi:TolB protein
MELFSNQKDIGALLHPGAASFDRKTKTYTLSGGGENMWAAKDAFHFLYAQVSGDLGISAEVAFVGKGTDKHRKACLMFRQDLDPDSAYIDVAVHGDGLTSLQFRESKGALTHEIQSNRIAPKQLRLEKRGPLVYLYLETQFSGASHRITLQDPFYAGLAVCSHNKDVSESATFSKVVLETRLKSSAQPTPYTTLETQGVASTDRRVIFTTRELIESPAWTLDAAALLLTIADQRYVVSATAPAAAPQKTSVSAVGIVPSLRSPDQKRELSISPSSDSSVNTLRLNQTLLANLTSAPGLSHQPCWSPDSKKIAFISYHPVP